MSSFKVMTWNIENLFSADSSDSPDTISTYNDKINNISDLIMFFQPDVIALQEIGDKTAFDDLLSKLPNAATTQILEGPSGSRIGTRAFYYKDKGDDTRLFNLFPLINEDRRYSRIHKNRKELLDHILVSQEMLPGEPRRLPIVDSIVDYFNVLPSTSDNPNERRKEPCSDHSPVTAEFNL